MTWVGLGRGHDALLDHGHALAVGQLELMGALPQPQYDDQDPGRDQGHDDHYEHLFAAHCTSTRSSLFAIRFSLFASRPPAVIALVAIRLGPYRDCFSGPAKQSGRPVSLILMTAGSGEPRTANRG